MSCWSFRSALWHFLFLDQIVVTRQRGRCSVQFWWRTLKSSIQLRTTRQRRKAPTSVRLLFCWIYALMNSSSRSTNSDESGLWLKSIRMSETAFSETISIEPPRFGWYDAGIDSRATIQLRLDVFYNSDIWQSRCYETYTNKYSIACATSSEDRVLTYRFELF